MSSFKPRVACIIPTYNGEKELERLLRSLEIQNEEFDTYIIDSSSTDGTLAIALRYLPASSIHSIPSIEFNHGGTRQLMVDKIPDYEFYIFLTQDAYLDNQESIKEIIAPFFNKAIGAVCGRQLPHDNANAFAIHARLFNYPRTSNVRGLENTTELGIKAAFISNSFAGYRREALVAVGGFPRHVIFAEDMYVAARMLQSGWRIAYAASATCKHSHNYSVGEEFKRYFDMGVFHAREKWIRQSLGGAGGEGVKFVRSELRFLIQKKLVILAFQSLFRNATKILAYKLGQCEKYLPIKIKTRLSMYRRYWQGPYAAQ